MRTVATFAEARRLYRGSVGLVPTMGYFHEGHLSLMRAARRAADTVVVSLFVNPTQFDDPADLARYPRQPERDAALAAEEGVDVLVVPPVEEVYPADLVRVRVAAVSERMEGSHRPGHFDGVATVVTKLFAGLAPQLAFFGCKDAQQLALVRTLVEDLRFPLQVVGCPTVREMDGLALSSRNVFLSEADRQRALGLSRGLFAAAELVEAGERSASVLEDAVRSASPEVFFEYVELASQDRAERLDHLDRPAFLGVAARVGSVRLIDNLAIDLEPGGEPRPDRGERLSVPSVLYRREP